jgi:hypothetical protein
MEWPCGIVKLVRCHAKNKSVCDQAVVRRSGRVASARWQITLPYFQVQRAKMILLAAQGLNNDDIAARLSTPREVVGRWRKRFFIDRLKGLEEQARPGRPRTFPPRPRRSG